MTHTSLTNELIKEVYAHSARRFFINKKKESELFSKLKLINDQKTIPILLPLVFSRNTRLAKVVASTLHQILIQTPVEKIITLDEMIIKNYYYLPSLNEIRVMAIKELNLEEPVCNSIFALLCSHGNGYIREAAMKELSFDFPSITIPVLLIRANDWVENIKAIATEKLKELINYNKINEFLPFLLLIRQLQRKERYDHSALTLLVENKLVQECYDELLKIIISPDKEKSRIAFRIAASDGSRLFQLINVSSLSHDLIIKLEILTIAEQHLSGHSLYDFLCNYLGDKLAVIRRKCIYILIDKFSDEMNPILTKTLFDKSLPLCELARFYLKRNGVTQPDKIYKDALINKERPLHIIIMGLAETGQKDDFKFIEQHLSNSIIATKSACIYAIFKLKPDNRQQLILTQLPSSEPMTIRTICTGLAKHFDDYDIDEIEKLFC